VRENKNNTVLSYLAWALNRLGLTITGMLHHRMGHTHSVLGAACSCFMLACGEV
jgi:hypothetical protein